MVALAGNSCIYETSQNIVFTKPPTGINKSQVTFYDYQPGDNSASRADQPFHLKTL